MMTQRGEGSEPGLWETMRTARTIRRFSDRPVDSALLTRCIEAATWAPSGGNQQPWHFVVITSGEGRAAMATGAAGALTLTEQVYRLVRPHPDDDSPRARNSRAMFALHDGAAEVPAAVLFCVRDQPGTPPLMLGASIFPAMQNFLLAARACGLGTCVTGWQETAADQLRAALAIPDGWNLAALVVVGWPDGRHGPLRRRPVADVASPRPLGPPPRLRPSAGASAKASAASGGGEHGRRREQLGCERSPYQRSSAARSPSRSSEPKTTRLCVAT